jgi:hypothetical protein
MSDSIRRLESDSDFLQAEEIFTSNAKILRGEVSFDSGVLFRNIKKSNHIFVGSFIEGQLIAFMTYKFYDQIPVCQVGNIYTKKGQFKRYTFSNPNNTVPRILDFILKDIEEQEYYTWYYCRATSPVYAKLEQKGEDLLRWTTHGYDQEKHQYRYTRYIEEIVPARTASKFLLHTKMFALSLWESEVMVVKCCLKPEYRKFGVENFGSN